MKLLKDYDCTIMYHLGKANIVADALSRKSMGSLAHIAEARQLLIYELHELKASGVKFEISKKEGAFSPYSGTILPCGHGEGSLRGKFQTL